jgi:hypothetical protein
MSVLHSIGWYRKHQLRHPDLAIWPAATSVSADDVRVAGESMTRTARTVGTPCTRVGERSPRWPGPDHDERFCAVIVTTVEAVAPAFDDNGPELWVDAELDGCEPLDQSMRLIGRSSHQSSDLYTVRPSRRYGDLRAWLPNDVAAGDLIAFVVARPIALHDIRRRSRHWERILDDSE